MPLVKLNLVLETVAGDVTYTRSLRLAETPRIGEGVLVEPEPSGPAIMIPRVREVIWRRGRAPLVVLRAGRPIVSAEVSAVEAAGWDRA